MRDFVGMWGYSYKEIMKMPRVQFALKHGDKFLKMGPSKLSRTIKKLTPELGYIPKRYCGNVECRPDIKATECIFRNSQLGVWDSCNVFI